MRILLLFLLSLLLLQEGRVQEVPLQLEVSPQGTIRELRWGGKLLLRNLGLKIVKPGWQGVYFDQSSAQGIEAEKRGDRMLYRGVLSCEGKPVKFSQEISVKGRTISLSYTLEPTTNLPVEAVLVSAYLPCQGNAGEAEWIAFNESNLSFRKEKFPAQLPSPYVLLSGFYDYIGWTLPSREHLAFIPQWGDIRFQLQDDRQFRGEDFELQIYSNHLGGALQPGKRLGMGFQLQVLSQEEAKKKEEEMRKKVSEKGIPMQANKPLRLKSLKPSAEELAKYDTLELTLDLDATFDNPFDPEDISVLAFFTSPGGKITRVRGFYYQDYERVVKDGREILRRKGEPVWKVRFTPSEVGTYRYYVRIKDRNGETRSKEYTLKVRDSKSDGFIRRSKESPFYLCFDSGKSYFPIGENMCWASLSDYERYLKRLSASGGNYIRVWMVRWNLGLEWSADDPNVNGTYYGLGRYSLDNAWRLDQLLKLARENRIYIMLCLGYHGELMEERGYFGEQCWDQNPYNARKGGPCQRARDFWTNPLAKKFYKQRLEYIVARWGYSPNILSFEFWNEVFAPAEWIEEMASYMRTIDPYKHLLTTTYGDEAVWRLKEMDYTQIHHYGGPDQRLHDCSTIFYSQCREYTEKFQKPFLIGEFGIDFSTSDRTHDPQGLGTNMHNGIWSAVMSRSMGTAMVWWWDNYVDPFDLYREFRAVSKFVADIPWSKRNYRYISTTDPYFLQEKHKYGDLTLIPPLGWGRATGTDFVIRRNGKVEGKGSFSSFLYSPGKPDLRVPLRFEVDYPEDGKFLFTVNTVSDSAEIVVRVDGREALVLRLPNDDPSPKEKRWQEQWKIWQYVYDKEYGIDVPRGKHRIELENRSGDWVSISQYRLTPYQDLGIPYVNIFGLCTDDEALVWIQNRESNWFNDKQGKVVERMDPFAFQILGLKDGEYKIQWYDTRKGEVIKEERKRATKGVLTINVEGLVRDVALKIRSTSP